MRNLIYLIIRYSALILFVCLEFLAFYLIVNYNKSQKEIWSYSSNLLSGKVYEQVDNFENFFQLRQINDSLLLENARLRQSIINYRLESAEGIFDDMILSDSTQNYTLIPSMICNKTLGFRNNYMTLCEGKSSGIEVGMGVISDKGPIGIVKSASSSFATVLLLTNSQSRISAKVKNKDFPGSLIWESDNPRILNLKDIPKYADISIGDSVVTSGFSICFPPDIYIGTIDDFAVEPGSNNYRIDVKMQESMAQIEYVYVVKYGLKEEKLKLITEEDG